jgi:Flp pilus assembly protein TadD
MPSHYFLGMSYFKTGTYKTAVNHLKPFADAQPKHPTIHGVLGICYENVGDANSAYNQYLMQVKVAPNNDMGKQAAGRINTLKSR